MSIRIDAAKPDYSRFASRLGAAIAPQYGPDFVPKFPAKNPFFTAVLDSIDDQDLRYLQMVAAGKAAPEWFLVRFHDQIDRYDQEMVVASIEKGVALVLETSREEGLDIDDCVIEHDGAEFFSGDAPVASIESMVFKAVDQGIRGRVISAMKGVRSWEAGRLAARLGDVPGLSVLVDDMPHRNGREYPWMPTIHNCAGALKAGMKRFLKIDVPLSRMQEEMAKALGVRNWATLLAAEKSDEHYHSPYALWDKSSDYGVKPARYFRSASEALAGLAGLTQELVPEGKLLSLSHSTYKGVFVRESGVYALPEGQESQLPHLQALDQTYSCSEVMDLVASRLVAGAITLGEALAEFAAA